MKKPAERILMLAVTLIVALLLAAAGAAGAESDFIPPTPEPPEPGRADRPTPAPTEVPENTVIDHINHPDDVPDFYFPRGSRLLEIWFPNIRDADEAILVYDGQVYMIDCGDERAAQRGVILLKQLGIKTVDMLFTSHLHHDHINGIGITDDAVRVAGVKICYPADSTESGLKLLEACEERVIPVTDYRDGDRFTMGGDGAVTLTFMKNSDPQLNMNNQGAITLVQYGERAILFTADMEKAGQEQILKAYGAERLQCDIVKYPHHGKMALTEEFYEALQAKLAVVTSAEGRKDEGQIYLKIKHMPVAYTSVKGKFVHLATDGKFWLCEYVPAVEK